MTPWTTSQVLVSAVQSGEVQKVKQALKDLHTAYPTRRALSSVLNTRLPERGDTLLHLVAALPHEESLCIGKLLLQEQDVHIDIQEHESGWTPLHKAIYYGNWGFAQALSSHSPDLTLRDREGLTPFDLLSLTLKDDLSRQHRSSQGVRKDPKMEYLKDNASGFPYTTPSTPSSRTTLYTWGSGANYNLGHADASDRIRPERVKLPQDPCLTPLSLDHPGLRPIKVIMGSRHSALITADPSDNLLTCGFGRGGRLGTGNETKMRFTPVKGISGRVTDVACGRDHTIVVTSCGTVWSFGSNAYGQLGRPLCPDGTGEEEETTDRKKERRRRKSEDGMDEEDGKEGSSVPRRVLGPLKRESMQGATASITASVVWSRRHIYVFGQNQGHLGLDGSTHDGIIRHPRRMALTLSGRDRGDDLGEGRWIQQVAITEKSMAILLSDGDVYVQAHGNLRKLTMPGSSFPREISPHILPRFRPIRIVGDGEGHMLAFLTKTGEVFLWTVGTSPKLELTVRRAWSSRKRENEAVDVGIGGLDSRSLMVCTRDGHVFTGHPRGGNATSGEAKKGRRYTWDRVDALPQGVSRVSLSSSTCYAAIRQEVPTHLVDPVPKEFFEVEEEYLSNQGDVQVMCHPSVDQTGDGRMVEVGRIQSDLLLSRSPTLHRVMSRDLSDHTTSSRKDGTLWEGPLPRTGEKGNARIHVRLSFQVPSPSWPGGHCGGYGQRAVPLASLVLYIKGASKSAVSRVIHWMMDGHKTRRWAGNESKKKEGEGEEGEGEEEEEEEEEEDEENGEWLEDYLVLLRIFGCETIQGRRPSLWKDLQPLYQSIRSTPPPSLKPDHSDDHPKLPQTGAYFSEQGQSLPWRPRRLHLILAKGEVRSWCHLTLLAYGSPFFAVLSQGQDSWLAWDPHPTGELYATVHMEHVTGKVMDVVLRWIYRYLPAHGVVPKVQMERIRRHIFGRSAWQTQEEVLDFLFQALALSDELLMPGLTRLIQQEILFQLHPKSVIDIYRRASAPGSEDLGEEVRRACTLYILEEMEWFYLRDQSSVPGLTKDLERMLSQGQTVHHPLIRGRMQKDQAEMLTLGKARLKSLEDGYERRSEERKGAKEDTDIPLLKTLGDEETLGKDGKVIDHLNPPSTEPWSNRSGSRNEEQVSGRGGGKGKSGSGKRSKFVPLDLSPAALPSMEPKPPALGWSSTSSSPALKSSLTETITDRVDEAFPTLSGSPSRSSPGSSSHAAGPSLSSSVPRVKLSQKQKKKLQQKASGEVKVEKSVMAWNVSASASPSLPSSSSPLSISSAPSKGKSVSISLRDIQQEEAMSKGNGKARGIAPLSPAQKEQAKEASSSLSSPPRSGRRRSSSGHRQAAPPPSSWQTPLAAPVMGSSAPTLTSSASSRIKGKGRSFNAIQQEQDHERNEKERMLQSNKSLLDIQTEELVLQGWRDYYAALGIKDWQPPPGWKME